MNIAPARTAVAVRAISHHRWKPWLPCAALPRQQRRHKTSSRPSPRVGREGTTTEVAVIGGGITGLAAANTLVHLMKEVPDLRVTLYESGKRLGGWLQTTSVNIGDGTVVFEQGPRTIRPDGVSAVYTKQLVCLVCSYAMLVSRGVFTSGCSSSSPQIRHSSSQCLRNIMVTYDHDRGDRMRAALLTLGGGVALPLQKRLNE